MSESDVAAAVGVVNDYFEAYNAGDDSAVLALLAPNATLSDPWSEEIDWESNLAWNTGQGTFLASPTCTAEEDQSREATTVSCDYDTLDALTQAVGSLPVATKTRFLVTSLGIGDAHHSYGVYDFAQVGEPFREWLLANRPEVTCLPWYVDGTCADSRSADDERETGMMVAKYGQEWATYLETNKCIYFEGC